MEINNLNASSAYTNASTANPPVHNTQLREQNIEASNAQLDRSTANAAQQAFEVTITQEAQNLQAQNAQQTEAAVLEAQAQTEQPQNQEDAVPSNKASQIVNIVA